MPKKRVFITGGAGFIGSHLCLRLLESGYQVVCLDNLITSNIDNIRPLMGNRNFVFIKSDACEKMCFAGKIDYLLHCASLASPEDYLSLPIPTLNVGSLGTLNSLELARNKKSVFVLFSTSEVYGDPLKHPQNESYWGNVNPVGVRSCYDESKRFAEALTMAYWRVYKLDTKIARIFNTYGPKMRSNDGRVVPNFISQALQNKPLTVYGKGRQTRSFCYIDDLVSGLYRLMRSALNEPVNLGNPNEFTVMQLAKLVLKLTGSKSSIVFRDLPKDDPRQRKPDISRAKSVLKWEPEVCLEAGLKKTISWFKA